jgi:DNA invertase Pin-like site-specific DNA recombinase
MKHGYEIVSTFQDRALSGADEDRPALWQALRALSKGMVLLVYRRDRLARNVFLAETITMKVREGGSRIEAVNGDVDGDGPESVLVRQVIAAISEYERKIIGMRTRAAMLHKQSKGQRMGRYAPYGFAIDGEDRNRLVPVPAEQDVCAEIVSLADLGHNPNSITRWLNTHRRDVCRSAEWTTRTVNKIVSRSKQA